MMTKAQTVAQILDTHVTLELGIHRMYLNLNVPQLQLSMEPSNFVALTASSASRRRR